MSSTWISATAALVSDRTPTVAEEATIDRVHELCRDWQSGLDLPTVRAMCSGRDRWIATRFTPPEHRMFRPLMAMLDALIATETSAAYGMQYQTPQGTFSQADLQEARARITPANGRLRILFPVLWPWRRAPDPDRADPGERGEPIYGETAEERNTLLSIKQSTGRTTRRTLD